MDDGDGCESDAPADRSGDQQGGGELAGTRRVGHGSLWLSNLREQNVWRIDLTQL